MRLAKRELLGRVWPFYSRRLDLVNRNALFRRWAADRAVDAPHLAGKLELYNVVAAHIGGASEQIEYLEFGVFQGNTMRAWTGLNTNPASRFVGFDSFEGLPETWEMGSAEMVAGTFATGRTPSIDDPRVSWRVGWFQDTLPGFLAGYERRGRIVIHGDADLYSSTLFHLTACSLLLRQGDIVLLDDFANVMHVFRAFEDWVSAFGIKYRVLGFAKPYFRQVAIEITE